MDSWDEKDDHPCLGISTPNLSISSHKKLWRVGVKAEFSQLNSTYQVKGGSTGYGNKAAK